MLGLLLGLSLTAAYHEGDDITLCWEKVIATRMLDECPDELTTEWGKKFKK